MRVYIYPMEEEQYLKNCKIDTSEEGITYWAGKIKCETKDLKNAIQTVGDSYSVLILFLELNRQITEE
jgi:hypothetical protein